MTRTLKIGNVELKNRYILAPMAGVTDLPFRLLCKEQGAGLLCMEMISAKALQYKNRNTKALLQIDPREYPVSLQLFGADPDIISEQAKAIEELPFQILDINMGCPVPKVVKNGEGSALMKNPRLVYDVVYKTVRAISKPVTVKIRKGFDEEHVNAVEIAKIIEEAGGAAVAVHGRTREQYYSGKADWDEIGKVVQTVSIPVIANGDIFTPEDAEHILRYTECELAMIGRGSFGNPWIFPRANALCGGEVVPDLPPLSERCDLALRQTELYAERFGERLACLEARHQLPWYLKGVANSSYYRQQLVRVETLEELHKIMSGIKRDLI